MGAYDIVPGVVAVLCPSKTLYVRWQGLRVSVHKVIPADGYMFKEDTVDVIPLENRPDSQNRAGFYWPLAELVHVDNKQAILNKLMDFEMLKDQEKGLI